MLTTQPARAGWRDRHDSTDYPCRGHSGFNRKSQQPGAKKLRISVTENDTLIKVGHDAMLAQAGAELELTEGGGGIKELVLEAGRVLSVFRPDGQERTIKNHGVTAGVRGTAVYSHQMHGQTYFLRLLRRCGLSIPRPDRPSRNQLPPSTDFQRGHYFPLELRCAGYAL